MTLSELTSELLLLVQEDTEEDSSPEEEGDNFSVATSVLAIVTFLVALSIAFEKGKEKLNEAYGKTHVKPVLESFFAEMTLLGFIGLVFFFISKFNALEPISIKLFGEEEDEKLNEMFETVHMVLFMVMMIFLIQVIFQLRIAGALEEKWKTWENRALMTIHGDHVDERKVNDEEYQIYWRLRQRFIDPTRGVESEQQRASSVRKSRHGKEADVESGEEQKIASVHGVETLEQEFDFANYLNKMLGEDLSELVEVPIAAWIVLWVLFVLYWGLDLVFNGDLTPLLYALVGGCYVLYLFVYVVKRKCAAILHQITAQHPASSHTNPISEPMMLSLQQGQHALPPYVNAPLDSKAAKHPHHHGKHKGDPVLLLKQHTLFWRHNPEMLLTILQIITLITAVLLSLCGLIVSDTKKLEMENGYRALFAVLAVIPVIMIELSTPYLLHTFTLILHLEQLRDHHAISDVRRDMRARKSLGALRVLAWMQKKVQKDTLSAEQKTAEEIWPDAEHRAAKRREVKALFAMFDDDDSGLITTDELRQLLQVAGGFDEDDQESIDEIVRQLDADGGGEIDFDEFFQWHANRSAADALSPDEVVHQIFAAIDEDGDGSLSLDELQQAFANLGEKMAASELQWIVQECDDDGDGHIDPEEFSALLKKYVFNK